MNSPTVNSRRAGAGVPARRSLAPITSGLLLIALAAASAPARAATASGGHPVTTASAAGLRSAVGPTSPAGPVATAGTIAAVAGGTGGPALATRVAIWFPCGVAYHAGYLYVGDQLVQRVSQATGQLATVAGGVRRDALPGDRAPLGDGGPAANAATSACGAAVDSHGNLVTADTTGREVRVVAARAGTFYGQAMRAGHIYRVAGDGQVGTAGNGGPAGAAELGDPIAVTVDSHGNLVIADAGVAARHVAAQIQVVAASTGTFYGLAMTAGDIYRVAGGTANLRVSGDGGPASQAGLGVSIGQVQLDAHGNLVLADAAANTVRVVAASTGTFYGTAMTAGDIYRVAGDGSRGFSGDGGPATQARLAGPLGVALDGHGNLVIADSGNDRLRVAAAASGTFYGVRMTAGDVYLVAGCGARCGLGEGGPALRGRLIDPDGVAVDGAGNLAVSEFGTGRISSDRRVRAIAASTGKFYGKQMTAGHIYTVAGDGSRGYSGDGGPAGAAVIMSTSDRMVTDSAGNLIVPAGQNNKVRVIPAASGTFYGVRMTAGRIYTVAGNGFGYSGNGGLATKAGLNFPDGLAVDAHGNLVLADGGDNRIRVIADHTGDFYGLRMTADHIYTVAGDGDGRFGGDGGPALKAALHVPGGLAVDAHGNLVAADEDNNRIRVVATGSGTFYGRRMIAGDIYTVAGDGSRGYSGDGGLATKAELAFPKAVAVDGHGNLVIADQRNNRIRVVAAATGTFYGQPMTAGHIYTVAGGGHQGPARAGGPATQTALSAPTDVTVDGHGNLVIADQGSDRVLVVAAVSGTFYGVPMTAGNIYPVAGDGQAGFSGDGGPATAARLASPTGVTVNRQGTLFIGDYFRIRAVTG